MNLNDHQLNAMVRETARTLMPFFDALQPKDQQQVTSEIALAALPIISILPEGVKADDLESFEGLIEKHALAVLIHKLREHGGLGGTSDEVIASHIDEDVVVMFARAIQQMVSVALDSIPPLDPELERLVRDFESIDLNEELKKLLDENKN